jgi:phosphoribosylamine---glycine ligase
VVIEINCRFGDPEAQLLMPLLDCDLLPLLIATTRDGDLKRMEVKFKPRKAVGIVLASEGYPSDVKPYLGRPITGVTKAKESGSLVFEAGTKVNEQSYLVTGGGRVLTVVHTAKSYYQARREAHNDAALIRFKGQQMRHDIADEAVDYEGSLA